MSYTIYNEYKPGHAPSIEISKTEKWIRVVHSHQEIDKISGNIFALKEGEKKDLLQQIENDIRVYKAICDKKTGKHVSYRVWLQAHMALGEAVAYQACLSDEKPKTKS